MKKRSAKDAYSPEFEAAWSAYPDRPNHSKPEAWKAWKARIRAGVAASQMTEGVVRYAAYIKACQRDPQYVKHAATFFGPGEHYLSDWTAPSITRTSRHSGFDKLDYSASDGMTAAPGRRLDPHRGFDTRNYEELPNGQFPD